MPGVARVTDTGNGHDNDDNEDYTTTFTTGVASVITNGLPTCVVTTQGDATCGHPTTAQTGSPNVFIGGLPAHRIGDIGANGGPYTVVTGSPNVIIN